MIGIQTNDAGTATFTTSLETGNIVGSYITATATDPGGNTSEFSAGRVVEPASSSGG